MKPTESPTAAASTPTNNQYAAKPNKVVKPQSFKTKGKAATGSPLDDINTNPFQEMVTKIGKIYDEVVAEAGIDRSNTFLRDMGTTTLTDIYKQDTPGQVVNNKFKLQFKNPKNDKEAASRSGDPKRKEMDLVPRNDPGRDRKKDSTFFRQQSIVKNSVSESVNSSGGGGVRGMGYVSGNVDGVLDGYVSQNIADADTRDNVMKAQLKAAHLDLHNKNTDSKDTKKVAKEETEVNEISKAFVQRFTSSMIAKHPDATTSHPIGPKGLKRKKALDLAMDKLIPSSAINKPHVLATEDTVNEISNELIGRVNKARWLGPKKSKTAVADATRERAVNRVRDRSNVGSAPVKEDTSVEKDPVKHLEDRLNTATDKSHNGIDKIMRQVANDYGIDVHHLHDIWVKKTGITPDQYVKEGYIRTPGRYSSQRKPLSQKALDILKNAEDEIGRRAVPSQKAIDDRKNKPRSEYEKEVKEAVWDEPAPKGKHGKMTSVQKAKAKARAKKAGRPYPNLIDNMAVMKDKK